MTDNQIGWISLAIIAAVFIITMYAFIQRLPVIINYLGSVPQ